MLTKRSGYGRNGGGFCVGVVVVVAFAVLAAIAAIGPARAHAYFDPSTGVYDIDVYEVGVGARFEDAPDAGWLLDRHASLVPHSVRQGWRITTAATAMDGLMTKYRSRELRPLVLAEFVPGVVNGVPDGTQLMPTRRAIRRALRRGRPVTVKVRITVAARPRTSGR